MPHPDHDRYRLVPHDPAWAGQAEVIINRMEDLFGACLVRAHHIGSTAVPGILAKPIIDILGEGIGLHEADACRDKVETAGYVWKGAHGITDRRYIHSQARDTHWHLFEAGSPEILRHLAFRDYLRTHPDRARDYEAVKVTAMARHHEDRGQYTDIKSPVLQAIEAEALVWHRLGRP